MISIYTEVFEKVQSILSKELTTNKEEITLDMQIFYHESALDFLYCLEEAFEIEISDDDFGRMITVKALIDYLSQEIYGIKLEEIELLEKERVENAQAREMERKALKFYNFIETLDVNEERVLEFIENQFVVSHYENIQKLRNFVANSGIQISELMKFAELFQDNFFTSHLDQICEIIHFLNKVKITRVEAIKLIQNGYIFSCRNKIQVLNNLIYEKEIAIQDRKSELQELVSEVDTLKQQIKNFFLQDY